MDKINNKLWIIEINFSKLPRINATYTCRRQSNRFKWFRFLLNITALKKIILLIYVCTLQNSIEYSPEQKIVLRLLRKLR